MFREFNFANAPFRNARLSRFIFASLAAVTLALTVAHGFVLARYLLRERRDLDDQVAQLRQELQQTEQTIAEARRTLQEDTNDIREERTRFLTRLYRRKGFSWTGLFNELEEITPAAVRVTTINPYEEDGELGVVLSLVGRTLDDVIEMVRQLEGSDIFDAVFPLEEAELNPDQGTGIEATLDLNYIERQSAPPPPATTDASEEDETPTGDAGETELPGLDDESGDSSPSAPMPSIETGADEGEVEFGSEFDPMDVMDPEEDEYAAPPPRPRPPSQPPSSEKDSRR